MDLGTLFTAGIFFVATLTFLLGGFTLVAREKVGFEAQSHVSQAL